MTCVSESSEDRSLLTVEDVAKFLKCSPRTVYRLTDAGLMPLPRKIRSMARWDRTEVEAWIAEGCKPIRRLSKKQGGAK